MINKQAVAVGVILLALLMSGCVGNNGTSGTGDSDNDWLDTYSPAHTAGNGSNQFWIDFPENSKYSGQQVQHLAWVEDSLKTNCVVFVVHKTGCVSCKAQADRVIALAEKYEGQVAFWDLDIPLGGDIEQKAYASYLYDPDGPPGYIALTGIFTYVQNTGDVEIGWHSWELNVQDAEMESWIQDAIYYYHENNGG
jgi:hypothetical protein